MSHCTVYEKLNYQADLCTIAAYNCLSKGHKEMAAIWLSHRTALLAIAAALPMYKAMEMVKCAE